MAQRLLHVLDGMGVIGLFITMAIKGSSFPFPVLLIVLTYGYLLNPSLTGMTSIALGMSLAYTIASYIPYTIGFKMEHKIKKRFQKKVKKVQVWFRKYGESIFALARPFTVAI